MRKLSFTSSVYHPGSEDALLGGAASSSGGKESIQAAVGHTKMAQYGVGATGSGSRVKGTISGTLKGYDYKAIYKVYNVKSSESSGVWVFKYQHDTSRDILEKTDGSNREVDLSYDMEFWVEGNDFGINQIYIYYSTIQLKTDTSTKQYIVTNNASASAADSSGNSYDGFTAV
jgi:hypothetical protein